MPYKDPEQRRARDKASREANKDKAKLRNKAYWKANSGKLSPKKNERKKISDGEVRQKLSLYKDLTMTEFDITREAARKAIEKEKERRRAYYQANREKLLAQMKSCREKKKASGLSYDKEYRQKIKSKLKVLEEITQEKEK